MYLSELVDILKNAINTSLPGNWGGGIVLPRDLPVDSGFDPFLAAEPSDLETGVWLVPGYNEYDLSSSRRSSTRTSNQVLVRPGLSIVKRVSVVVCRPFEAKLDISDFRNDVTHTSEWALLSNLREDLEAFLIHLPIESLKLVDIEALPPDELSLDNRIYLAATSLGYSPC